MTIRQTNWENAKAKSFDIAIVGGGISGASIYRRLCQQGYRVLLIDKGDFSSGTSQASAMMIWGGLLYLKNLDLVTVYSLSHDRDRLIRSHPSHIAAQSFRYIPNRQWGHNKYFVYLALQFYWMLGQCLRKRPTFQRFYEELKFMGHGYDEGALTYQEGHLKQSDSRFVLDWILDHQTEDCLAINYCSIQHANFNKKDKRWAIDLRDCFTGDPCTVKANLLLNCAGVWVDRINAQFGIQTPYKHVYSKGVFIGYKRPDGHQVPLVLETGENGDAMTLYPWGPVSLWGPTETTETSIEEGYTITPEDVQYLLKMRSRHLDPAWFTSQIVSLRCGLRPLAVKKSFTATCHPLQLSRHYKIDDHADVPWISVYGGKISGCVSLAERVVKRIQHKFPPGKKRSACPNRRGEKTVFTYFPGLHDRVPALDGCVRHEFCCTLDDYLRRRTNISQWVAREGLGFQNENMEHLRELSTGLPEYSGKHHDSHLDAYVDRVRDRFDNVLAQAQ